MITNCSTNSLAGFPQSAVLSGFCGLTTYQDSLKIGDSMKMEIRSCPAFQCAFFRLSRILAVKRFQILEFLFLSSI